MTPHAPVAHILQHTIRHLNTIIAFATAIILMLLVRAFLLTLYLVSERRPAPGLVNGDRIIVNRLDNGDLQRGDLIVFECKDDYIGVVTAVPGDTVKINGKTCVLPDKCPCSLCDDDNCKYYMVNTGTREKLINSRMVVGKGKKLFHLNLW